MHTQTRFRELTERALERGIDSCFENQTPETIDSYFQCESANLARVVALSEELGMSRSSIISELLACALGDAHDGFLSAFSDVKERNRRNGFLKARVKELLESQNC